MKFSSLFAVACALAAQAEALAVHGHAKHGALAKRATTTTTTSKTTSSTKTTSTTSSKSSSSSSSTKTTSTTSSSPSSSKSSSSSSSSSSKSSSVAGSPTTTSSGSSSTGGPMVFAHYMLITTPPNNDYTNDMKLAKAAGIDAFAVNYGGWSVDYNVQNTYLTNIYNAAAANGMKLFLSVDCTSTDSSGNKLTASQVISLYNSVYNKPAALMINGQPVLSSYQDWNGAPFNWKTDVIANLQVKPFFMPSSLDTSATNVFGQDVGASGYFPWIHPYQSPSAELATDQQMAQQRASTGKKWMAALSPWFFKRFDANDNWAHAQDGDIFITRAMNLLSLKPDFIELVTWNDWGESSYFGPYDTTNECPTCYWAKVDHSAALTVASAFIRAYKAGQTTVSSASGQSEGAWLYYRRQPNNVLGSSGDNGLPLPQNYDSWTNRTFVVGLFNSPTTVTVSSGSSSYTLNFPAGLSQQAVAWGGYGTQSISASRSGQTIVASKSGPVTNAQLTQYDGNVVWV